MFFKKLCDRSNEFAKSKRSSFLRCYLLSLVWEKQRKKKEEEEEEMGLGEKKSKVIFEM